METTTTPNRLQVSNSFKTFLERNYTRSKVARLLYTAATSNHPAATRITTDAINYLTNRTDGTISFLPKGKELKYNEFNQWARDNRQDIKPRRISKLLFSTAAQRLLKPYDLDVFGDIYKASTALAASLDLHIISGSAIRLAYHTREVGENDSPLKSSCMQGGVDDDDNDFFELYTENSHAVSMVVLYRKDSRELYARALLWTINGQKYLDRIYAQHNEGVEYLRQWAAEQGYFWRTYNSHTDKEWFTAPDGKEVKIRLEVTGLQTDFDYYPYIDTFSFGGDGYLRNWNDNKDATEVYEYRNTDGSRDVYGFDIYGNKWHEGHLRFSVFHGDYVHNDDCQRLWNPIEGGWDYYHCNAVTNRFRMIDTSSADKIAGGWINIDAAFKRVGVYIDPTACPTAVSYSENETIIRTTEEIRFYPD
jgi:hypothetical protein